MKQTKTMFKPTHYDYNAKKKVIVLNYGNVRNNVEWTLQDASGNTYKQFDSFISIL